MRAAIGLAVGIAMLTAANAAPEGDGESGLCDGIAAAIRANPGAVPGEKFDDPFKGTTPWLTPAKVGRQFAQLADPSDGDVFAAAFARRYKPDAALRENLKHFYADHLEEVSVGPVHLLTDTGGSASCQGFLLFETIKGGTRSLPDLPPSSGDYCGGDGGQGELIAIHGQPAFLATQTDISNFRYTLGIAMLRPDHWAPACKVEVAFRRTLVITEVVIPRDSAVSRPALEATALRLAAASYRQGGYQTFGNIPPEQKPALVQLAGLGMTAERGGAYGPLMLDGQLYWAQIQEDGIGWRPSPDRLFSLWAVRNGVLVPAATVKIGGSRGKLSAISVARGTW